jgi:hypothetical protein
MLVNHRCAVEPDASVIHAPRLDDLARLGSGVFPREGPWHSSVVLSENPGMGVDLDRKTLDRFKA